MKVASGSQNRGFNAVVFALYKLMRLEKMQSDGLRFFVRLKSLNCTRFDGMNNNIQ